MGSSVNVLVIDDDPMVIKLVEKSCQEAGYNIISTFDVHNGLIVAKRQKPDLIILDVLLPDSDGFTALGQLKADPVTAFIPVIMLTIKSLDGDIQRGLDLGAEDYISKPIHTGLLIKRIENVLKKVRED